MEKLREKKKLIYCVLGLIAIFLGVGAAGLCLGNQYYLELNTQGEQIVIEYGEQEITDIQALCKGTVWNRKGTPVKTKIVGEVDFEKLGTYKVTFEADYKKMKLSEKRTVVIQDTTPPEIELVSNGDSYANPGLGYQEEGFQAIDNFDGDLTEQVKVKEKDGVVTYTVTDSSGNRAKAKRKLIYKDVIAPVITLKQGNNLKVNRGSNFSDPGFTATDECDGDITKNVSVEGSVDATKDGTYTLTYTVADSSGNQTKIKRKVRVGDFVAPVITLRGEKSSYIKVGTAYTDPGYTATDNVDGNLTSKVTVSGKVDTSKMGRNVVTYTVVDSSGNKTTVERVVYMFEKQASYHPVNPGNKVVYLTFDDGPSRYTSKLLGILDKYGVKATFFVTNQFPAYQYMIGETHRRGHTIALHTYKHNYASVYASEDAYYKDLYLIRDICIRQTGVEPKIVRFPGGTSNTVSRRYCKGIMTSLTKSLQYHGYLYCDWNVSSADTSSYANRTKIANNVIAGIKRNSVSIVLQHDITDRSVSAVEDILFWGIQNGYTFLPMTETTPMVHYKPQN